MMTKNPEKEKTSGTANPELDALEREAQEAAAAEPAAENGKPLEPEAVSFPMDPAMLGIFWDTIFGIVAARGGEHWRLTKAEAAQLGQLTVPIAEKWLPSFMNKYGPEMMLGSMLIFTIIPRLGKRSDEKDSGSIGHTGEAGFGKEHAGKGAFTPRHI